MTQLLPITLPGAGISIAGERGGPAHGVPVILMHGAGQTRFSWKGASSHLAQRGYNVLSLDLRGHGDSDWSPDGNYGFDSFIADLVTVLDRFDRLPFLVGASMGGLNALLTVGEGHARAAGLMLVDVAPRLETSGVSQITQFMRADAAHGFASLEDAAQAVAQYRRGQARSGDPAGLLRNLRLRPDGRYYWHWDPAFMAGTYSPADQAATTERLRAAAAALTIPTALVRGGQSNVVSAESVADFRTLVPHAEIVEIAEAGHMIAGDRNDRFSDAVVDFISRHAHQA